MQRPSTRIGQQPQSPRSTAPLAEPLGLGRPGSLGSTPRPPPPCSCLSLRLLLDTCLGPSSKAQGLEALSSIMAVDYFPKRALALLDHSC